MTNNNYLDFIPETISSQPLNEDDLLFIFYRNKILISYEKDIPAIPKFYEFTKLSLKNFDQYYLGKLNSTPCYAIKLNEQPALCDKMKLEELRSVALSIGQDLFNISGKAYQIINWQETTKFCGRCGSILENHKFERSKICPKCGLVSYTKISPAIIVAVTKDNKLLLAHNNNFPEGLYSVLAGFLEPGETVEQCIKREVYEETKIKIKDIKYFSSQPWSFPDSLMLGFTASYESGDIEVDGDEIACADWFSIDSMPMIPSKISIARKLIDHFIESQSN
jgi:NAD+ diphosphatase